jgi:hypothetical protein
MSAEESRYTLSYYTTPEPDPTGVPFKYRSPYLADALAEAWRLRDSGGRALSITHDGITVYGEPGLQGVLARMSDLIGPAPERRLREVAEEVISETDEVAQRG